MKRTRGSWAAVVGALVIVGLAAPARGDDQKPAKGKDDKVSAQGQTVRGKILEVKDDRLVIKGAAGKEIRLHADAGTKLRLNDRDAKLADFLVDTEVLATFESRGGKNVIISLISVPNSGLDEKDRNPSPK